MKLFMILLTVLFIGLKLSDNIDWNWFLVLSPLIIFISLWFLVKLFWYVTAYLYPEWVLKTILELEEKETKNPFRRIDKFK